MYTVSNQKLSAIEPYYTDDLTKDFDEDMLVQELSEIIDPLFTPLQAQYPVEVIDQKKNILSKDDIAKEIINTLGATINADAEDNINSFWRQTLADFKAGTTAAEVFVAQANASLKLPHPSPAVIYTPQDIRDACRHYIADQVQNKNELIVNSAYYIHEPCVIVAFLSKFTFDSYKQYIANAVQLLSAQLSPETIQKFHDFQNLALDLVEGIILRGNDTEDAEAYSFSRVLMQATIKYAKISSDTEVIAPYIDELVNPKNLVFINVDRVAKAKPHQITHAFKDVIDGIKTSFKPVNIGKISKLSTAAVSKRKIAQTLMNHQMLAKQAHDLQKRGIFKFRQVQMTKHDLSKNIVQIIKKETNVSASENYSKFIKSSFMRASRRRPDDFNVPGKSISLKYKPDIHIYLDTSGSISEDNYRDAILTLITMAKKLDVNLYFNSFSHRISQCVKLNIRGQSIGNIFKEFQQVPKVTGGTDYHQVWDYIMRSPKRKKEISLMITDFEYAPPRQHVLHPPKLYYAPISLERQYWQYLTGEAERFCKNMYHLDKQIRKKMLIN